MTYTITKAVVAAGGAGSKMAPITRVLPKEMLPVGRKPILEHLVLELHQAGITDVLFAISSHKPQIPAYFGSGSSYNMSFSYQVQDLGAGPGAPVLAAEQWTQGAPFVLAFGDNLVRARPHSPSPLQRLVTDAANCSVLTRVFPAEGVPPHETLLGAAPAPGPNTLHQPEPFTREHLDHSRARWVHCCAARWVLGEYVFDALRNCPKRADGELYLIDAIQRRIQDGHTLNVHRLLPDEARFNCDNWSTYENAVTLLRS
ncbi:sugar phosphate nucleotidyltransferase [Streptomyces sp. NPDC055089]